MPKTKTEAETNAVDKGKKQNMVRICHPISGQVNEMSMQTLLIGLGAIYLHHLRWEKKVIFTHCYKEYAINMHEDLEKNMHEDYEKFDDCSNAFIGWLRIVCEKECAASLCNIILREVDSDNVTYLDVPESFLD